MSRLTQADQYLLDQIRRGSEQGWSQLVDRYQGRLLAFAQSTVRDTGESEDLVQETFVSFLTSLSAFRSQASLETYLFTILRRKIVDYFRGKRVNVCLLQDAFGSGRQNRDNQSSVNISEQIASTEPTASWCARQGEQHDHRQTALSSVLSELINELKQSLKFRDLQVVEMIFYCQLRNKDAATIVHINEKQIALIKHRYLKQIRNRIAHVLNPNRSTSAPGDHTIDDFPELTLSRIWQEQRLSCLKRSTIGSYLLDTLEPPWHDYVAFHLDQLGCHFCLANLEDLKRQTSNQQNQVLRNQIMQSTVGFLRNP